MVKGMSESETVYIKVLNERTEVWRPVECINQDDFIFLIPNDTKVPDTETWQFQPGARIQCGVRELTSNRKIIVAYSLV